MGPTTNPDPLGWLDAHEVKAILTDYARASRLLMDSAAALGMAPAYRTGSLDPAARRTLLHAIADVAAHRMRDLGEALRADLAPHETKAATIAAGRIGDAFREMGRALRVAFLAGHLALRGPGVPAEPDRAQLAAQTAKQEGYLRQFEAAVLDGSQPPDGTLVSRAEMYGHATWSVAWDVARSDALAGGMREESNTLGASEHCPGCLAETSRGFVPIGSLVPVGSRECRVGCRCFYQFR